MKLFFLLSCIIAGLYCTKGESWTYSTWSKLDDYLRDSNNDPPDAGYKLILSYQIGDMNFFVLNVTTVQWKDEKFSSRPVWYSIMTVYIPLQTVAQSTDTAVFFIAPGDNDDSPLKLDQDPLFNFFVEAANKTKGVCVYMKQNPNSPIKFPSSTSNRWNEELIGKTLKLFLEDSTQADNSIYFPLARAVKEGMDAVTPFVAMVDGSFNINKFISMGISMGGGWAAAMSAALDTRVIGYVSIVNNLFNFDETMKYHLRSLGGYSVALYNVWKFGVFSSLGTSTMNDYISQTDPYAYRDRLAKKKKLVILGTNDNSMLPDGTKHWLKNGLEENNHLMFCANTDITLAGWHTRVADQLIAFTFVVRDNFILPEMSWIHDEGSSQEYSSINVTTSVAPTVFKAYVAKSYVGRRDIRFDTGYGSELQAVSFDVATVTQLSNTSYHHQLNNKLTNQWWAHYIYMEFPGPQGTIYRMTTPMYFFPDTYPFPACTTPSECNGYMI